MRLIALNLAILVGASLFFTFSNIAYRRHAQTESLRDNKFLTAEWRLMKELKERTDRELRDKDSEIAELRHRYLGLKDSGSSAEMLAGIEKEMKLAEAERENILSSRLKAVVEAPAVAPPPAAPPSAQERSVMAEVPGQPSTALNELLRRRIASLEAQLESGRSSAASLRQQLDSLRRDSGSQVGSDSTRAAAVPAAAPFSPAPASSPSPASPAATDDSIAAILAVLERERVSLADPQATLSLTDLKTRALLRAILRTPAIRAEYPDLIESLDRYLANVGKEEYLRGEREAFADAAATVKTLSGR
jgi:hypothetical protein